MLLLLRRITSLPKQSKTRHLSEAELIKVQGREVQEAVMVGKDREAGDRERGGEVEVLRHIIEGLGGMTRRCRRWERLPGCRVAAQACGTRVFCDADIVKA